MKKQEWIKPYIKSNQAWTVFLFIVFVLGLLALSMGYTFSSLWVMIVGLIMMGTCLFGLLYLHLVNRVHHNTALLQEIYQELEKQSNTSK